MTLWDRFRANTALDDCPIYDLHGHWGAFYGSHLPAADVDVAIKLMDRSGVKMLVFSSHEALFSPDIGNTVNVETVRRFPGRMKAYLCVNPNYPDNIEKDLAAYDDYSDVYVGIKMLAPYHGVPMSDDRYKSAWEFADERGLLVLMHTWGGCGICGYEPLKKVLEKYHNARALLGHSLHGSPQDAIALARDYPNAYLELCAILDDRGVVDGFVEAVGSEKIVFGTDFPWFSYPYYIGAVLGADMSDEDRRNILYRNAQRLLGEI